MKPCGGISTHTLTWSVTFYDWYKLSRSKCISTHTLTWSVTNFTYLIQIQRKNFNSHAHVERDLPVLPCGQDKP